MPTRRTPEQLVKHREDELARSRRKLARAKDPIISDWEHLRDDLITFRRTVYPHPPEAATTPADVLTTRPLDQAAELIGAAIEKRIDLALKES